MSTTVVKLNVGGVKYMTSFSTLTLVEPESTLARMVQQREARMIQNGEDIFIDRDGDLFKYILDYLRNPSTHSPWGCEDPIVVKRLRLEANYLGMLGLQRKLQDGYHSPSSTGEQIDFKPDTTWEMIEKSSGRNPLEMLEKPAFNFEANNENGFIAENPINRSYQKVEHLSSDDPVSITNVPCELPIPDAAGPRSSSSFLLHMPCTTSDKDASDVKHRDSPAPSPTVQEKCTLAISTSVHF